MQPVRDNIGARASSQQPCVHLPLEGGPDDLPVIQFRHSGLDGFAEAATGGSNVAVYGKY